MSNTSLSDRDATPNIAGGISKPTDEQSGERQSAYFSRSKISMRAIYPSPFPPTSLPLSPFFSVPSSPSLCLPLPPVFPFLPHLTFPSPSPPSPTFPFPPPLALHDNGIACADALPIPLRDLSPLFHVMCPSSFHIVLSDLDNAGSLRLDISKTSIYVASITYLWLHRSKALDYNPKYQKNHWGS